MYKDKADQAAAARRHYEANKDKMKARAVLARRVLKAKIRAHIEEVKDVPCMDCGQKYAWYIMEFDHVRGDKLFNLADAGRLGKPFAKVLEEIEKCEVVCANCHRARTWQRKESVLQSTHG